MTTSLAGKIAVVLATAFAIAAPSWQALSRWGLTAAEFSAPGDGVLRAAPYAFSIWTLIYVGLICYAIYQARSTQPWLKSLAAPAAIAISGCGFWILASAANARWATVVIILTSAGAALVAVLRARGAPSTWSARLFAVWPLALLGGWLLVASGLNLLTVLTAEDFLTPPAPLAAALSIGAVAVITIWVLRVGGSLAYGLSPAWGLIAVFVAEQEEQPVSGNLAIGVALALLVAAGALGWRRSFR